MDGHDLERPGDRLLRIGEVARLFNVSAGTLRHYEQEGLLEPAYVDPETGYRYYGTRQLSGLNTISHLRVLGLSLSQIGAFTRTRDVGVMERQLAQQQELIARKQRELERAARKVAQRLEILRDATSATLDTITETDEPAARCVVLRETVRPTGAFGLEWQIRKLQQGQDETFVFMGNLGVGIDAEHLLEGTLDRYDQVFLMLDETDRYRGDVQVLPAAHCATIYFSGTHEHAPARYRELMAYLDAHALVPAGPSREIALIDEVISDDPATFVTKITIPVVPR